MDKIEFNAAVKIAGKIRRKVTQDAFLLAFGLGLQRSPMRPVGALIVRCAKRLAKHDGLSARELKKAISAAKKAISK